MLDEAAGAGHRVVAEILRVFVFMPGDGHRKVTVVLLAQIQIEEPLVIRAVVATIVPIPKQPDARGAMFRPVGTELPNQKHWDVDEVGFRQLQIRRFPIDRAELFIGSGKDQIGVLFQQRVQSVQGSAWPTAEHVDMVPLTPHCEPVVVRQPGEIFLEVLRVGGPNEDLGVGPLAGCVQDRHFSARDLLDPVADIVRREHLGPSRRVRKHEFARRFPTLHQRRGQQLRCAHAEQRDQQIFRFHVSIAFLQHVTE